MSCSSDFEFSLDVSKLTLRPSKKTTMHNIKKSFVSREPRPHIKKYKPPLMSLHPRLKMRYLLESKKTKLTASIEERRAKFHQFCTINKINYESGWPDELDFDDTWSETPTKVTVDKVVDAFTSKKATFEVSLRRKYERAVRFCRFMPDPFESGWPEDGEQTSPYQSAGFVFDRNTNEDAASSHTTELNCFEWPNHECTSSSVDARTKTNSSYCSNLFEHPNFMKDYSRARAHNYSSCSDITSSYYGTSEGSVASFWKQNVVESEDSGPSENAVLSSFERAGPLAASYTNEPSFVEKTSVCSQEFDTEEMPSEAYLESSENVMNVEEGFGQERTKFPSASCTIDEFLAEKVDFSHPGYRTSSIVASFEYSKQNAFGKIKNHDSNYEVGSIDHAPCTGSKETLVATKSTSEKEEKRLTSLIQMFERITDLGSQ